MEHELVIRRIPFQPGVLMARSNGYFGSAKAQADATGDIDRLVSVDFIIVRPPTCRRTLQGHAAPAPDLRFGPPTSWPARVTALRRSMTPFTRPSYTKDAHLGNKRAFLGICGNTHAVLLSMKKMALTAAALTAGALTFVTAPLGHADPEDVTHKIEIKTCQIGNAGTDDDVQINFYNAEGKQSGWRVLDKSGYDDFENNATDTYEYKVSADFGPLTQVEVKTYGLDNWCFNYVWVDSRAMTLPSVETLGPANYWITRYSEGEECSQTACHWNFKQYTGVRSFTW
ncbi:PLAT/LH2 domain-containing protein [Streptomyces sp. NPDC014685]|uniref:PLAT/LH2 domain-containing protein n=1 Tax=Streptomyces sp. NPDC014685 TaxID=3364881 RepID=UPI0036FE0F0A